MTFCTTSYLYDQLASQHQVLLDVRAGQQAEPVNLIAPSSV
jgi:hypothetical protein